MNVKDIVFFIFFAIALIIWFITLISIIRIMIIIRPYRKEIKDYYKILGINYYETPTYKRKKIFIEYIKDLDIVINKDELLNTILLSEKRIKILIIVFFVCLLLSFLFILI